MTMFMIYLIGVFIAMIILVRDTLKEFDVITLQSVVIGLIFSLCSWAIVVVKIGEYVNWDTVIWRRKK